MSFREYSELTRHIIRGSSPGTLDREVPLFAAGFPSHPFPSLSRFGLELSRICMSQSCLSRHKFERLSERLLAGGEITGSYSALPLLFRPFPSLSVSPFVSLPLPCSHSLVGRAQLLIVIRTLLWPSGFACPFSRSLPVMRLCVLLLACAVSAVFGLRPLGVAHDWYPHPGELTSILLSPEDRTRKMTSLTCRDPLSSSSCSSRARPTYPLSLSLCSLSLSPHE